MIPESAGEAVSEVAKRLGLTADFVVRLLCEDDWSYVVKAHALAEAAITHAIVRRIGLESTRAIFANLPMGQRLRLASALSLLPPGRAKGIQHLSKLRNLLAHDVARVGFTFESHLREHDARSAFYGTFLDGVDGTIDIQGKIVDKRRFFEENPKWAVNACLFGLMLDVYFTERDAQYREALEKSLEGLLQLTQGDDSASAIEEAR